MLVPLQLRVRALQRLVRLLELRPARGEVLAEGEEIRVARAQLRAPILLDLRAMPVQPDGEQAEEQENERADRCTERDRDQGASTDEGQ